MKLRNYSSIKDEKINSSELNTYLKKLVFDIKDLVYKHNINLEIILEKQIEKDYDISFKEIKSKTRKREVLILRQLVIWILEFCTYHSHENIGKILNRNQSIVVNSSTKIFNMLSNKKYGDKEFKKEVYKFLKKVYLILVEKGNEIDKLNKKEKEITIHEYKKAISIVYLFELQQKKLNNKILI